MASRGEKPDQDSSSAVIGMADVDVDRMHRSAEEWRTRGIVAKTAHERETCERLAALYEQMIQRLQDCRRREEFL
jgi:hypothetical protein